MQQRRGGIGARAFHATCVVPQVAPLDVGQILVPSTRRRIVVSARVDNGVVDIVVGQMWVVAMTVERELQNASAGELKDVTKHAHIRRDDSQILGQEWQSPDDLLYDAEQAGARTRDPFTRLRCWRRGRHMPGG